MQVYSVLVLNITLNMMFVFSELPSSPSDYAASAAQSVIGQVLEGVQTLPDDARVPALAEAMTAFMEAWMEHILKQKIKFRLVYMWWSNGFTVALQCSFT